MGNNIRSRILDRDTIAKVVNYIKSGGSYFRVARRLRVTHSTLIYHCRRAGISNNLKIGRKANNEKLPKIPYFYPRNKRIKKVEEVILDPLPGRFEEDNSWYLSCIQKSKMSSKKKKEIIENYKNHKDESQLIIYNVNLESFSQLN